MVQLEHFSRVPLVDLHPVEQAAGPGIKPVGLWVGVKGERSWAQWCRRNGLFLDRLTYRYDIALARDASILHIGSDAALDAFDARYGHHIENEAGEAALAGAAGLSAGPRFPGVGDLRKTRLRFILWARVASEYDGILIAPVLEARRTDPRFMPWYYGWDADSGCIWNPRAIAAINPGS